MHTACKRILSCTLSLIVLSSAVLVAPSAEAKVIQRKTLISGNGPIGTLDPLNEFSDDNGATWAPAPIISSTVKFTPVPVLINYATIPGTRHIARNGSGSAADNSTTLYRTFFNLPAEFKRPRLRIKLHADNAATIFLNGTEIGGHRIFNEERNFKNPADSFRTRDESLFQAGQNELRFAVFNDRGPSLLDYEAKLVYLTLEEALSDFGPVPNPCANPTHVGTDGNEVFFLEGGPFIVDAKGGDDIIVTGDEDDIVCGGDGDDIIVTHDGNDRVFGGNGNDTIEGRSGNDVLLGEGGDDTIDGGLGIDVCVDPAGQNTISNCP